MSDISRRGFVLSSAAAMAVFGLDKPVEVIGTAHAQQKIKRGYQAGAFGTPESWAKMRFKRFRIGGLRAWMIYDGVWERPHSPDFVRNASIDDVKANLRAAGLSDASVPIPFSVLVVQVRGNFVMFDAGTGGQLQASAGRLHENMRAAGIDPAKIKTIAISHFHPDHVFGLMAKTTNAQIYPNAEIIMPTPEYRYWINPKLTDEPAQRLQHTLPDWKNIRLIDGEVEIAPGIRSLPAYGHTPGHTCYTIASRRRQLLVLGDVCALPVLFARNPGWHIMYDMDPAMAEATRRRLFDRVIADRMLVAGYHFGLPGAGRLMRDGPRYVFRPAA